MLDDALELLQRKAGEIRLAANALQAQKTERLAGELEFSLEVLSELLLDDPVAEVTIGPIRRISVSEDDDYPDGVSDDDPEKETPEERRRREEFKDRGFFG